MSNTNFIILVILYALFFCITLFLLIKRVYNRKKIELSDFFKLFYIFFYGIVPICTLIAFKAGKENIIKAYYLENKSIYLNYAIYALTVIFYLLYNIAFNYLEKKKWTFKLNKMIPIDENSKSFYVANFILLLIGWFSLFMYTIAYGGIFATFKYAEEIRNNICTISNNFTYFQPFTMLLLFLPLNYLVLFRNIKEKGLKYKIVTTILFFASIVGCILVLLIIDSRSRMLMTILIIIYYYFKNKILDFNKKSIAKLVVIMFLFLLILVNSENISGLLHNQERTEQKSQINEFIAQEFGYTYLNGVNVIYRKVNGINGNVRIFDNILGITISLLPRSIQRKMVVSMPAYNTAFFHKSIGTVPSDLITSSIYSLGYAGPFIFPFWIALLTYCLNLIISNGIKKNNYYQMLESYLGFQVCMSLISNYDMSAIIFSCFEFIVWIITIRFISLKCFDKLINNVYKFLT